MIKALWAVQTCTSTSETSEMRKLPSEPSFVGLFVVCGEEDRLRKSTVALICFGSCAQNRSWPRPSIWHRYATLTLKHGTTIVIWMFWPEKVAPSSMPKRSSKNKWKARLPIHNQCFIIVWSHGSSANWWLSTQRRRPFREGSLIYKAWQLNLIMTLTHKWSL